MECYITLSNIPGIGPVTCFLADHFEGVMNFSLIKYSLLKIINGGDVNYPKLQPLVEGVT